VRVGSDEESSIEPDICSGQEASMSDRGESSSRRGFVRGLTLAGTASLLGLHPEPAAAEPPPETTKLRTVHVGAACVAPQYVSGQLLHAEGFTDLQYVKARTVPGFFKAVATGEADFTQSTVLPTIMRLDAGDPIVILAGVHPGCYELFGTDQVHSIKDLKGKAVAVLDLGGGDQAYIAIMVSSVGLI
jgi:NitT/TauT family transport system substrate-binding protein